VFYTRKQVVVDKIPVKFISPEYLKINKKAGGRHKDLEDFKHLP
jgi:hypothetical protein